jgi:hypothetical protein
MTISEAFRTKGRASFDELLGIARGICDDYGLSARNIELRLGISIVTGKPLMESGK